MKHLLCGWVAIVVVPASVAAQTTPTVATPRVDAAGAVQRPPSLSPSGTDARTGILQGPSLAVTASSDESEVALTYAPKTNGLLTRTGQTTWSLTFKAPLDKQAGSGSLVTDQGLADQFAGEFSLTRIFATFGAADALAEQAKRDFDDGCREEARHTNEFKELKGDPSGTPSLEARQKTFESGYCPRGNWASLDERVLRRFLSPAEVAALKGQELAQADKPIWILNVTSSLGYRKFKFLNATTFDASQQSRLSYSFSVSGGVNISRDGPFFGAGYEYKREYKEKDKRVICPANLAPGTPTSCKLDVFDSPELNVSHDVFGVVRITNFLGGIGSSTHNLPIAIEAKATYDIHNRIFGISAPVYLLLDDKGGFRGGVKFSWADRSLDSPKSEFRVGLFIVKSFDFFGLGSS